MTIPKTVARFNAYLTKPRLSPVRVALGLLDVRDLLSMRPAPAQF